MSANVPSLGFITIHGVKILNYMQPAMQNKRKSMVSNVLKGLDLLMLIPYPKLSSRGENETFGLHNFQLQAMLKRVVLHSLGLVEHTDHTDPRKKNQVKKGTKASSEFNPRSKALAVRIVHAGGQQEVYQHEIPASKLMAKYPGMFVARPEVFRNPHHSVLEPEEHLLLGHKYVIISSRDVEKLKRKYPEQVKSKECNRVVTQEKLDAQIIRSPKENGKISVPNGVASQEMMEARTTLSHNKCKIQENSNKVKESKGLGEEKVKAKMNRSPTGGGVAEESFGSAKEFSVSSKEKSPKYTRRKGIKGKKPFLPPLPKGRSYRGLGWQPSLPTVQEASP